MLIGKQAAGQSSEIFNVLLEKDETAFLVYMHPSLLFGSVNHHIIIALRMSGILPFVDTCATLWRTGIIPIACELLRTGNHVLAPQ